MPPNQHALLSASSAHRWTHCTPSARLEQEFADRETEAAAEGTAAHALCEHKLRRVLKMRSKKPVSQYDSDEMDGFTDDYVQFVKEAILDAVVQLIMGIVNALPELIQSIIEVLPTLIDKIITAVVNMIPVLIQAILDCLPTLINGLIQLIMGIVGAIPEIIKSIYYRSFNTNNNTWSEWKNALVNIPPRTITTAMLGNVWISYDILDDEYIRYFDFTHPTEFDSLFDYGIYTGDADNEWITQHDVIGHFVLLVVEDNQVLFFPECSKLFARTRPVNSDWLDWVDISPVDEERVNTLAETVVNNKLANYYTQAETNRKLADKENIVVMTSAQLSDCDNCYVAETLYRMIINGQEQLLVNAGTRSAQYRFTKDNVYYRTYQNREWSEWKSIMTMIPDDTITGNMIQQGAITADNLQDIYPALHYADSVSGEGDINDWGNGIYIGELTENWRARYGVWGHYILIADGMQIMYIPEANRIQFRERGHMGRWDSWTIIDLCNHFELHDAVHGENGTIAENYAWYTDPSQGLSLTGTYSLVGDFCTINGTCPLVEGWETVYYSLPCNSLFSASAIARCGDDVFTIATNTLDNISVIEIKKLGGGTMPSGTISFTLRYRYLEAEIGG